MSFRGSRQKHLRKKKAKAIKEGHRCFYCRRRLHPALCSCRNCKDNRYGLAATWDHFKPLAKGGSNKQSNLVLACRQCNQEKGIKDGLVFMKGQGYI